VASEIDGEAIVASSSDFEGLARLLEQGQDGVSAFAVLVVLEIDRKRPIDRVLEDAHKVRLYFDAIPGEASISDGGNKLNS
jgi:hypothetical protein